MAKYNIGGYIFNDEESAKKAAKELKAVEYILAQIKVADEKDVLQIYKKIINQRLFSTEIGMGFLSQLRQNLIASDAFESDEVPEIYSLESDEPIVDEQIKKETKKDIVKEVKEDTKKDDNKVEKKEAKKELKKDNVPLEKTIKRLRLINSILIIISITLLLCVVGMFYISSTINSPTIMNYKETITDEYSQWKQELDQREADLNARERALEELENNQ